MHYQSLTRRRNTEKDNIAHIYMSDLSKNLHTKNISPPAYDATLLKTLQPQSYISHTLEEV